MNGIRHEPSAVTRRRRGGLAALAALVLVGSLAAGCATPRTAGSSPVASLTTLLASGDLRGADALIAQHPNELDSRRALDAAIRGGHIGAVRHYLPRAGVNAPLDLDATTPLIRAVVDGPSISRSALVSTLMAAGASPSQPDRYGRDARTYAVVRNQADLLTLMDGLVVAADPRASSSRAAPWFGLSAGAPGSAAPAPGLAGSAGRTGAAGSGTAGTSGAAGSPGASGTKPAAKASGTSTNVQTAAVRAGAIDRGTPAGAGRASGSVAGSSEALSTGLLLRGSPWVPAAASERSSAPLAALRFHADGTADLLRHPVGSRRFDAMAGAWVAWRLDAGNLHVAIVGEPFSAWCRGGVAAGPRLRLDCQERPPVPPQRDATAGQDLARAQLIALEATEAPPAPPSLFALAFARTPAGAADDTVAEPTQVPAAVAAPGRPSMAVSMLGVGAPGACTPRRVDARPTRPPARSFGDWYALDTRRFEAAAPLSGRLCPQTQARDAALKACRAGAAGQRGVCQSVGGCPVGQASALAGLPGVASGWVACDADLEGARRKALAACRSELGCDCQLIALSGRNLNTLAGEASCTAPAGMTR